MFDSAVGKKEVGTLPSNDRKEIEHCQDAYLGKISTLLDDNERNMDLLVN